MENTSIYSTNKPMSKSKFSELYKIMEYSFPETERGNEQLHYSEYSRPEFRCLCYEPQNKPLAFINYYEFKDEHIIFVEHFAVAEELRGKGTGTALMRYLMDISEEYLIVLEVEPPEGETECRRIAFYERLGFVFNNGTYFQPEFYGKIPELPLKLMTTRPINDIEFKELSAFIHKRVYRK